MHSRAPSLQHRPACDIFPFELLSKNGGRVAFATPSRFRNSPWLARLHLRLISKAASFARQGLRGLSSANHVCILLCSLICSHVWLPSTKQVAASNRQSCPRTTVGINTQRCISKYTDYKTWRNPTVADFF